MLRWRDWAVVLSRPLLFRNLHYIRWEADRAALSLAELGRAIHHVREIMKRKVTRLLATDFNTTLVEDSEGLVGPFVMRRPLSHSLSEV